MIRHLCVVLMIGFFASSGCNRGNDAEVAKLKAEAEAAKAESLAAKAELTMAKAEAATTSTESSRPKSNQTPSDSATVQREAARWILSIGGRMRVAAEDKSVDISGVDGKLPDGAFRIVGIQLPGGDKVTNEGKLHLIVDNNATHKHQKVRNWLKRHPRFHLHFTPTSSSLLNVIERWFRDLTQKRLRRGVFKSVEQLKKAIDDYIAHHNEHPRTFVWTKKASDILEKVARARKALNKVASA